MRIRAPTKTCEVAMSAALLLQIVQAPRANCTKTSASQTCAAERAGAGICRLREILMATELRPTTIRTAQTR